MSENQPEKIGKYEIIRLVGKGGMGEIGSIIFSNGLGLFIKATHGAQALALPLAV